MKIISSHNGLEGTRRAFEILSGGGSPVDAVVAGASVVEDDPADMTVGYGGLPNEQGVVELDAAVMDGRTHSAGAVAAMQGVRHATGVARLVMEWTDRVLLAGEGARQFALANGFEEENLLTDRARRMWLYWKRRRSDRNDWLPPDEEHDLELERYYREIFDQGIGGAAHGTVHFAAIDGAGDMACATSTSGHAFKMPGRVGDSPIIGAGLFVDNKFGTCGSIGRGESNLENLSSHLGVMLMRQGLSPQEAGLDVLRQIQEKTPARHRDEKGRMKFDLRFFLLAKDGTHAGVCTWGPKQMAITDSAGTRLEPCVALYGDE